MPYSLRESSRSLYVGRSAGPEVCLVLSCYFDDSRGDGVHAIAGYVGVTDVWDGLFSDRWRAVIDAAPHKIEEFKASDCRHRTGEFQDFSRDECNALTVGVTDVLVSADIPLLFGLGVAVHLPPTGDEAVDREREHAGLYVAFLEIITIVMSVAHETEGVIQCVCDEQPGMMGAMTDLWANAREVTKRQGAPAKISHLQFEDSKELPPLQAADVLAYESRKDLLNRLEKPQRPRSRALTKLVRAKPHMGWVVDTGYISRRLHGRGLAEASPPLLYWSEHVTDLFPLYYGGDVMALSPDAIVVDP